MQSQRSRTRLPDAYAVSRGSVFLHSFLASGFTRGEQILSDFVAGPDEHFIRGLPFEGRVGHHFIVRLDVELGNERPVLVTCT